MTTATVMITGTRAPAALDLARSFAAAGWRVIGADRPLWPVSRLSRAFAAHYRLPPPRAAHHAFAERLADLIGLERVDLLVPTCEEAFFMARHRARLDGLCRVACPDFATMRRLHDKAALPEMAGGLGVEVPETLRVTDQADLRAALARLGEAVVLKPAFSRFASRTLIRPSARQAADLRPSPAEPWACQRFVAGDEICTYAVACQGRLTAFAAYRPRHRVGQGAGILFEPVEAAQPQAFAAAFARRHQLDGQFAFDLIRAADGRWFVIECNPRATSGVHLFRGGAALAEAFMGKDVGGAAPARPGMVGLAMALVGLPRALAAGRLGTALADWRRAEDAVARPGDRGPALSQWLALVEGLANAARHGCSPLAATTADIEWNGEDLA
ncbi:MAG TPA: hypothetical protein VK196_12095 [Magnetospirillum sp.]|nr:hypothetical protein [Magnetospirillum sp.]